MPEETMTDIQEQLGRTGITEEETPQEEEVPEEVSTKMHDNQMSPVSIAVDGDM
jgi:hypothetical protein